MFRKYFDPKYAVVWIFAVVCLAFVVRVYSIGSYPAGFNADEASFGYDAYSILKTGKDQWGSTMPLVLKSFGDYKSPLYSYLSIPFVALGGLTIEAVRLPSAIAGALTVFITYLLGLKIFAKNKVFLALLSAFLLAVSPWHIMISRAAIEANLTVLFTSLGVLFFLKGLDKPKYFIVSSLFFGLNLFTYHSGKLLTPILVGGFLIFFNRNLKKISFKKLLPSGIVFGIFFILFIYTFALGGGSRISERSIFQGALVEGAEKKITLIQKGTNPFIAKLRHNKYQVVVERFFNNYRQYFSPKFASQGAGEGYYAMVPGIGVFYIFELFLIAGIVLLYKDKKEMKMVGMLVAWLLIAPLPAALATGVGYSGTRASAMLPVVQILAAFGLAGWLSLFKNRSFQLLLFTFFLVGISLLEIRKFKTEYFSSNHSMLWGNLQVSEWLAENKGTRNIVVSRSLSEPQIFVAFVNKWDPGNYQEATKSWNLKEANVGWVDQLPEWRLGPYIFRSINWEMDSKISDTYIVARPGELPEDVSPVYTVKYKNGDPAILVVDTNLKAYAKAY